MLLNVQENNFIYRNPSFNYQVSYPKGWKMAELKDGEDLVTNAWFDSESVMSADDFGKVDDAPGSIWIYADQGTESIVGIENFKTELIGSEHEVSAKVFESNCEKNCPNPAWENRTDIRYYIDLPEKNRKGKYTSLVIEMNYKNGQLNEKLDATLNSFLDSFKFNESL